MRSIGLSLAASIVALVSATSVVAEAQQSPAVAAQSASENAVSDDSRFALEAILARLRVEDRESRREAAEQLQRLEPSDVPAIRQRLLSQLGTSHFNVHAAMVRAIRAVTGGRENAEFDLLQALINYSPRGPDIDIATERIALATALGAIKTPDSGRALVAFGLSHNRIFRLATIRIARNQLKLYVVPALIELRRPTEDTRLYIRQVREAVRCVTPGQSVQTRDNALLAEILRAWGSVRQQDAMVVITSYVNSDRVQVREAARWAIAQFGRDSINTLRNVYETFVGEDPNPLWGWERISRELYAAYDRRKSDEVRAALDAGLAAAREGRNDVMLERFEWVLARHPLFERRGEMVEPLVRYARTLERSDVGRAAVLYRMALRVDPEGPKASQIRGAILFLEAERALARGVADPELYRAAVLADPTHQRARAQFDAVAQVEVLKSRRRRRAIGAAGLLVVAAASAGVLYNESKRRSPKKKPKAKAVAKAPPPASDVSKGGDEAPVVAKDATESVSATSTPPVEVTDSGAASSVVPAESTAPSAESLVETESASAAKAVSGRDDGITETPAKEPSAAAVVVAPEPAPAVAATAPPSAEGGVEASNERESATTSGERETAEASAPPSAERTQPDSGDEGEEPPEEPAAPRRRSATRSREPGIIDLLVSVAGGTKKSKKRRP
jgi:hypothetical protein